MADIRIPAIIQVVNLIRVTPLSLGTSRRLFKRFQYEVRKNACKCSVTRPLSRLLLRSTCHGSGGCGSWLLAKRRKELVDGQRVDYVLLFDPAAARCCNSILHEAKVGSGVRIG